MMKKQKKPARAAQKSTSNDAFLKAVRTAQQRAAEAKRTARIAKLQWKEAKIAYKQARDAAHDGEFIYRTLRPIAGRLR